MNENPLCSKCGTPATTPAPRYCRNCGAAFAPVELQDEDERTLINTSNENRNSFPDASHQEQLRDDETVTLIAPQTFSSDDDSAGDSSSKGVLSNYSSPLRSSPLTGEFPSSDDSITTTLNKTETTTLYTRGTRAAGDTAIINQNTQYLDAQESFGAKSSDKLSNDLPPPPSSRVVVPMPGNDSLARAISKSVPPASVTPQYQRASSPRKSSTTKPLLALAFVVGAVIAAALGVWFAWHSNRTEQASDAVQSPTPLVIAALNEMPPDEPLSFEEQLNEAQNLIARGEASRAVELLRQVVADNPENPDAYLRLGEALELTNNRIEAINSYGESVRFAPLNALALQRLATAQAAENRFAEAADNFKKLLALPPNTIAAAGANVDDNLRLRAALTYKLAGRFEDATRLYTQLATSNLAPSRDVARRQLEDLAQQLGVNPPPTLQPTPRAENTENAEARPTPLVSSAVRPPLSSPTPDTRNLDSRERYQRARVLWRTDRAAATREFRAIAAQVPEANYYVALSYAEGKQPRTMNRAELLAALQYFQLSRNSQFRREAREYEERLTAEYDRRRREER